MTVNDMTFKLAGEAGQGVESSGAGFAKALARAGLHVVTASDYMSRIRGGHNSFTIRVSDQPLHTHGDSVHLLLAFDKESFEKDLDGIPAGGAVIYDEKMRVDEKALRAKGILPFSMPLNRLAEEVGGNKIMANTAALSAAAGVTGFDLRYVESVIDDNFSKKKGSSIAEANKKVAQAAYEMARERYGGDFRWKIEARPGRPKQVLLNGNQALSMGALAAGCRFISAYPMTPASSILEWLTAHANRYGLVSKQTEDEIAAVCMALGAAHVGARAMTATSGGGFSLMVEALGLAGMTEQPVVIVDAQRPGPSTGMPTRTDQGDLLFVLHASQGEFPRIVLAPGTVAQNFECAVRAFNLAEKYQTPVILMTDLHLTTQLQSLDPSLFPITEVEIDRGKLLSAEELDRLTEPYARFKVTEDGVSPRAVPGHPKAVYTAPSDEHTEFGVFESEDAENRVKMYEKRARKLEAARQEMRGPEVYGAANAELTLMGWGGSYGAMREAVDRLQSQGVRANMLHFTDIWPFPEVSKRAIEQARYLVAVESNGTGQFARLVRAETGREADELITRIDGRPLTPDYILARLRKVEAYARREAV